MMKALHPILSLFLSGLMLVASIGVMVNSHICGGEVKSVALFVKPDPCKPCIGAEHHAKKNGCCEEQTVIVKSDETSPILKITKPAAPSLSVIAVILPVSYSIVYSDPTVATLRYVLCKPPLPERDITLFAHSLLI
ncbi:MAG TPA: hypothetical protein DDZ56_14430 [Cytophagales bacterium]|nr:hypothetical protein [Cytophagales bacterium]